jgi:hypothetical protein
MPAKGTSKYTREQITEALALVVAHQGNVMAASKDENCDVPYEALKKWVEELHRDEYVEIDRKHAAGLEDEILRATRANVRKAARIEDTLLDRLAEVQPREIPAALQSVAAVKDKGIGKMLALTGRPVDGNQNGPGQLIEALHHLEKKGLLKINVPNWDVDGTAAELPEGSG